MSKANKIWLSTVEKINEELNSRGKPFWERLEFELQDDHQFLLIVMDVPDPPTEKLHEMISELLREVVEIKIPSLEDDYPWTCVIRYKGEVVDSIFPGFSRRPEA